MAWITPTIAAVGAIANLASSGMRSQQTNQAQQQDQSLQWAALNQAAANQRNQALVQALINQRSVAGTADAYGGGTQYDPATNTWTTTQGKLPAAATTAAMQAAIARNTTDLRQAQFANEQEAVRAARAGPTADAAQRELAGYRPMTSDTLTGLLGQQATLANNAVFNPLVADTLRSFARTGTSAGPVLGQIGRDAATNLRQSMIDAQIKGMTSVDQINEARRQGLEQSAGNTRSLATPQFQYSNVNSPNVDNTMAQVVSQRATSAGIAPVYGMAGANEASKQLGASYGVAGAHIADPNYSSVAQQSLLKDLGTSFGSGGGVNNAIKAAQNAGWFGTGTTTNQGDSAPGTLTTYNVPGTTAGDPWSTYQSSSNPNENWTTQ